MSYLDPYRLRDRAVLARVILAVVFLVVGGAFFRLQVLQNDRYRLRAQSNRLREVVLSAPRGPILDRNGLVIAENVPGYTVKLFAPSVDSLRAVLDRFQKLVPLDSATVAQVLSRYRSAPYQPALVLGSTSFDLIARLEEHRISLPGLVIQTEPRRRYPAGSAVAHVVGYVGEISERELASTGFPGARLGTVIGKDGLEARYDSVLRGRDGVRFIEVNARGRMVREETSALSRMPVPGDPIQTTIDLPLQEYIDSLWQASVPHFSGAMVAMAPDGGVLALYSTPTYDPNEFVGGISTDQYRALTSEEAGKPLFNRAIQGTYPPASPFKLAIAAMALRRGLVRFDTHMDQPCRGGLRFGNRTFRCWKREGHGSLDLEGAIARSCDVYFYQLGLRLGLNAILEDGIEMGFRERSEIDLGGDTRSSFPSGTAYYDRLYGPRGWTNAVVLNLSIGQGENDQSLMNVMRLYQALATDGVSPAPYLVARTTAETRDLALAPDAVAGLRRAMIAVVERGTGAASRIADFQMAGKTGTAQNSHGADHGWFIGFAPADKPEIIVGAIMEKGLHGSSVGPYVARVIRRYLEPSEGDRSVDIKLLFPEDSAPRPVFLTPDTVGRGGDGP